MIFYRAARAYTAGSNPQYRPFEPMMLAYNETVDACLSRDRSRALHSIAYLYRMLDYQYAPFESAELAKLYAHCEKLIRQANFQDAISIFEKLRRTWNQIATLSGQPPSLTA